MRCIDSSSALRASLAANEADASTIATLLATMPVSPIGRRMGELDLADCNARIAALRSELRLVDYSLSA